MPGRTENMLVERVARLCFEGALNSTLICSGTLLSRTERSGGRGAGTRDHSGFEQAYGWLDRRRQAEAGHALAAAVRAGPGDRPDDARDIGRGARHLGPADGGRAWSSRLPGN